MPVHEFIPRPQHPGPWIDPPHLLTRRHRGGCTVCGESYADFTASVSTFSEAVDYVRAHNDGNWWQSRGPVLWVLRTIKLAEFYAAHEACGALETPPF